MFNKSDDKAGLGKEHFWMVYSLQKIRWRNLVSVMKPTVIIAIAFVLLVPEFFLSTTYADQWCEDFKNTFGHTDEECDMVLKSIGERRTPDNQKSQLELVIFDPHSNDDFQLILDIAITQKGFGTVLIDPSLIYIQDKSKNSHYPVFDSQYCPNTDAKLLEPGKRIETKICFSELLFEDIHLIILPIDASNFFVWDRFGGYSELERFDNPRWSSINQKVRFQECAEDFKSDYDTKYFTEEFQFKNKFKGTFLIDDKFGEFYELTDSERDLLIKMGIYRDASNIDSPHTYFLFYTFEENTFSMSSEKYFNLQKNYVMTVLSESWKLGGLPHTIESFSPIVEKQRNLSENILGFEGYYQVTILLENGQKAKWLVPMYIFSFFDEGIGTFALFDFNPSIEPKSKICNYSLEIASSYQVEKLDTVSTSNTVTQKLNEQNESDSPKIVPPSGGGCLIATATFDSELAPQVQKLREIRDSKLLQTESGSQFMEHFNSFYYSFSPIIADYERENPVFKEIVKAGITPMLSTLSLMDYADTESEVLTIGISLIILNGMMYVGLPVFGIMIAKKRF